MTCDARIYLWHCACGMCTWAYMCVCAHMGVWEGTFIKAHTHTRRARFQLAYLPQDMVQSQPLFWLLSEHMTNFQSKTERTSSGGLGFWVSWKKRKKKTHGIWLLLLDIITPGYSAWNCMRDSALPAGSVQGPHCQNVDGGATRDAHAIEVSKSK